MSRKKGKKMEDLTDVYNDLIMEHSMNSYNKKKLPEADFCEIGHNPNCGDEISIELKLNGDIIEDMAFTGHGCAISQASTSIMIEEFKILFRRRIRRRNKKINRRSKRNHKNIYRNDKKRNNR